MKKKQSLCFAAMAVMLAGQLSSTGAAVPEKLALDDPLRLNDMVITLLMPAVTSAAEQFYEPYLTIAPTIAPYYSSKILQIQGGERIHEGIYNSDYTVAMEVLPYIGPHLAVGKDIVTLKIQPGGTAVTNYEHCESYALPPNYQPLLKQPLP